MYVGVCIATANTIWQAVIKRGHLSTISFHRRAEVTHEIRLREGESPASGEQNLPSLLSPPPILLPLTLTLTVSATKQILTLD